MKEGHDEESDEGVVCEEEHVEESAAHVVEGRQEDHHSAETSAEP